MPRPLHIACQPKTTVGPSPKGDSGRLTVDHCHPPTIRVLAALAATDELLQHVDVRAQAALRRALACQIEVILAAQVAGALQGRGLALTLVELTTPAARAAFESVGIREQSLTGSRRQRAGSSRVTYRPADLAPLTWTAAWALRRAAATPEVVIAEIQRALAGLEVRHAA